MDYSKFVRKRLTNIGVSRKDAALVSRWYIQQLSCQGEVRAIQYLKSIGDCILWYLYESPERPTWVATKHRFPKALYFLRKYDERILVRIAKFARAIRLPNLVDHQVSKVVQGATAPFSGTDSSCDWLSHFIEMGVNHYGLMSSSVQPSGPRPIGRVFRRVMSRSGPTKLTMEPPILESLEIVNQVPALYNLPYWKEAFQPLSWQFLEDYFERYEGPEGHAVGEIHAAQEGGGKLRMYASPYTVVQCLLYPIHYWVDRYRRLLPTDCTYNQLSGAEWAQSQLLNGVTVYSVDLSTATCRFPLKVQLDLLESLGLAESFREAIKWACTGDWIVGSELLPAFPTSLRWSVGQPLGIAPSMSMFSLAHNLLITGMCVSIGLDPGTSFRVLGDDVVMVDERLYNLYTLMMETAGVPISWSKCHQSEKIAEFAGATITRDFVLRPGQWREAGINNHLSIASDLKTPLVGEVSRLWVEVEKIYLFLNGTYDPPVSEWSKYLRYATLAGRIRDEIPDPVEGVSWDHGVRRCAIRQFKTKGIYPEFGPDGTDLVESIYSGLPDTSQIRDCKKGSLWHSHLVVDQIMIEA